MTKTEKTIVVTYGELFSNLGYVGAEWICIGGENAGRIALVSNEYGLAELIWKDTKEQLNLEKDRFIPFVPKR